MKFKIVNPILTVLTLLTVMAAKAHCPHELKSNSTAYCLDVQWLNGQKKARGQFVDSPERSPSLNQSSIRPERWIYSQAHVYVWEKGKGHHPVFIEGLEIFPYMVMVNNHGHGAKSKFEYDNANKRYILSQISFQEMGLGCWQLRASWPGFGEEHVLFNITEFKNVTADINYDQAMACEICTTAPAIDNSANEDSTDGERSHH